MRTPVRLTLIAALTAMALPAFAQEAPPPAGDDMGPGMMGPGMFGPAMSGPAFDFKAVDTDGDGKISQTEMKTWHEARLKAADTNGDGFVDAAEMKAQMLARIEARLDEMVQRRIERKDTDKDGKLSPAEMMPANADEVMFARLDANADGSVTQDEIDAMQARMQERMKGGERGHGHGHHGKGHGGGWGWMMFGGDDAAPDAGN